MPNCATIKQIAKMQQAGAICINKSSSSHHCFLPSMPIAIPLPAKGMSIAAHKGGFPPSNSKEAKAKQEAYWLREFWPISIA
jgi:hypothetical protein